MNFLFLFNCGQPYSSVWTEEQVPSHPVAEAAPMCRTQAKTDVPCRSESLCSAARHGGLRSTTHLGGCPSRGGVRCRDRPLLLIGERGHLSQASALLSPLSCLARGGCRYPRSRSFTLPVLAVAVMPAHHLAAASVNLHQRRRRAPPMGRHQRCRPHRRRCKPSGSQSPAMGGRLAAVQKLGKDTGMTILCFF